MLLNKDEKATFLKSKSVLPMGRITKDGNFRKYQNKNYNYNQNEDFRFNILY